MSPGLVETVVAPPFLVLRCLLRLQLRLQLRQLPLTLGSNLPVAHTRSYCERKGVIHQ